MLTPLMHRGERVPTASPHHSFWEHPSPSTAWISPHPKNFPLSLQTEPFESALGDPQGVSPPQFCIFLHPATLSHPVLLPSVFQEWISSLSPSWDRDRGRMSAEEQSWRQPSGPEAREPPACPWPVAVARPLPGAQHTGMP